MAKSKKTTSIRLTPDALRLLRAVAEKLGVTQSAVFEMAVRRFAQAEKVP